MRILFDMSNLYTQIKEIFKPIFTRYLDLILPPRCPITGDIVDAQGVMSSQAWQGLAFISDPKCTCCGIALDFELSGNVKCDKCMESPPEFICARSALVYNDTSRDLILGFKHGDKTHLIQTFIPWLRQAGKDLFDQADYLVPVPLHSMRMIMRRYNQAGLISESLSRSVNVTHFSDALVRIRSTPSQGHLTSADRVENVHNAFDILPKNISKIKGKKFILIDDVYTTGATVNECSRVLYNYGAESVSVLTIARVINSA